jgi:hypothetical protein
MNYTRKGLGKGLGTGYKNLAPMDSHVHRMSAKGQKTFLQRLGVGVKSKGRQSKGIKIYTGDLTKIGGLVKSRKEKEYPYTKREKKIGLATVGGAGVGFVIGGFTGGLGGILLGVPIGTFAGNIIARKSIPQKGRKSDVKFGFIKRFTTAREDLLKEKDNINRVERARAKSERQGRLLGVYAKGVKRR